MTHEQEVEGLREQLRLSRESYARVAAELADRREKDVAAQAKRERELRDEYHLGYGHGRDSVTP